MSFEEPRDNFNFDLGEGGMIPETKLDADKEDQESRDPRRRFTNEFQKIFPTVLKRENIPASSTETRKQDARTRISSKTEKLDVEKTTPEKPLITFSNRAENNPDGTREQDKKIYELDGQIRHGDEPGSSNEQLHTIGAVLQSMNYAKPEAGGASKGKLSLQSITAKPRAVINKPRAAILGFFAAFIALIAAILILYA